MDIRFDELFVLTNKMSQMFAILMKFHVSPGGIREMERKYKSVSFAKYMIKYSIVDRLSKKYRVKYRQYCERA